MPACVKKRNKLAVFKRHNGKCAYCNNLVQIGIKITSPDLATVDHIIPSSKGGSHGKANLLLACRKCNEMRADTPIELFLNSLNKYLDKENLIVYPIN